MYLDNGGAMKVKGLHIIFALFGLATGTVLASSSIIPSYSQAPVPHPSKSGDLAEVLSFLAHTYRLPLIAELAQPLPKVTIAANKQRVPQVFDSLMQQAPGYAWAWENGVVHVFNKRLLTQSKNFLNWRLTNFISPIDLGTFSSALPTQLHNLEIGYHGLGSVGNGLIPQKLQQILLPGQTFRNASARQILFSTAQSSKQFYSIVVFPNAHPRTHADAEFAFQNWFWRAIGDQSSQHIYAQKPPSRVVIQK